MYTHLVSAKSTYHWWNIKCLRALPGAPQICPFLPQKVGLKYSGYYTKYPVNNWSYYIDWLNVQTINQKSQKVFKCVPTLGATCLEVGAVHSTSYRTNEIQSITLTHKIFISQELRIMDMNHLFHINAGNFEHESSKQRKEVKNPKETRVARGRGRGRRKLNGWISLPKLLLVNCHKKQHCRSYENNCI